MKELPLCGARGEMTRLTCQLPDGHVKTADDRHQVISKTSHLMKSGGVETDSTTIEVHSWPPSRFELAEED